MTCRRVVFNAILTLGVLAASLSASAQPGSKLFRIGALGNEDTPPWMAVEGRNITMESRWSEGKTDRLPALAMELVGLKVDVIVASGTQAVRAAIQATSTIPIVMTVSAHPDKIGLVQSIARPGGNVTGLSNIAPELYGKRLQLLREIAPGISRLAVVWNPASPVEPYAYGDLLAAGSAAGVGIDSVEVRGPDDFRAASPPSRQPASMPCWPSAIPSTSGVGSSSRTSPSGTGFPASTRSDSSSRPAASCPTPRASPISFAARRDVRGQDPEGGQARRPSDRATHEVRARRQPENRKGPRARDSAGRAHPGGCGHRVIGEGRADSDARGHPEGLTGHGPSSRIG